MLSKPIIQQTRVYTFTSSFLDKAIGVGPINWHALALTRFLLSFIVVSAHVVTEVSNPGPLKWINNFGAFNAIIGFLLISGLSIGSSIVKNKESYFSRRVQRIYPVYLASIVLQYLITPEDISIIFVSTIIINLFFLNQIIVPTSYVGPAWTLALEVWLYSLAPLLLKQSYRFLLTTVIVSFISYCLYTCGRTLFDWPFYSGVSYGLNLLLLSFIWVIGFMLAIFTNKTKETSILIGILLICHFLLTIFISFAYRIKHDQVNFFLSQDTIKHTFEIVCLICVYIVVVGNRNLPKLSSFNKKLFNFLGNISYPLYLTHSSILTLCENFHISNWFLVILFCLITATIVYWLFDFYSKKRAA